MNMQRTFALILAATTALTTIASAGAVDELTASYRSSGAGNFSAKKGEEMWNAQSPTGKGGKPMSCATCHGADLRKGGQHVETGKAIDPMAPSANSKRLTDVKEVEKWFKRNCKETYSRECTPQEKGDFLAFISSK